MIFSESARIPPMFKVYLPLRREKKGLANRARKNINQRTNANDLRAWAKFAGISDITPILIHREGNAGFAVVSTVDGSLTQLT